jgi:hypothetical protein
MVNTCVGTIGFVEDAGRIGAFGVVPFPSAVAAGAAVSVVAIVVWWNSR